MGSGKQPIPGGIDDDTGQASGGIFQRYSRDGAVIAPYGYAPDPDVTGQGKCLLNVPNYTNHMTGGVVQAVEIVRHTWTEAEKVTGLRITGNTISATPSDFVGFYLAINAALGSEQEEALQSIVGTDRVRFWCGKEFINWFFLTDAYILSASLVAVGNEAPNNFGDIAVF